MAKMCCVGFRDFTLAAGVESLGRAAQAPLGFLAFCRVWKGRRVQWMGGAWWSKVVLKP